MSKGKLFVLSGASGVGKSTVLKGVMDARDDLLFSVSATTRDPREGEVEGISYYFVTKEAFEEMIRQDAFVEYDAHMKNYYGTPKSQLEEKLSRGNVILDIEPNGAFQVRKNRPDACLIFIAPPSREELERRLRGRGDTPEDQIRVRLERAQWEMDMSEKYDHVVINEQVQTCVDEILKIIAQVAD
ncbi:MAG: guanylate kinase [Ruminococcaceae bacterium]|nr:guanylate kinase [Oscillospiraceae bacterium]